MPMQSGNGISLAVHPSVLIERKRCKKLVNAPMGTDLGGAQLGGEETREPECLGLEPRARASSCAWFLADDSRVLYPGY